jgi:recombinational DNA repair protein (RecF pathway)
MDAFNGDVSNDFYKAGNRFICAMLHMKLLQVFGNKDNFREHAVCNQFVRLVNHFSLHDEIVAIVER